jgi:hypothetical protein
MIMIKIKKDYNSKVIVLIIGTAIVFLFSNVTYSYSNSEFFLRAPLGNYKSMEIFFRNKSSSSNKGGELLIEGFSKDKKIRISYARRYFSPKQKKLNAEEVKIREITLVGIKQGNEEALAEAASQMAQFVEHDDILIPIPDSKGDTSSNLRLAKRISIIVKAKVEDVLGKHGLTISQRITHQLGKSGLSPDEIGFYAKKQINPEHVVFIDDHVSVGTTIKAAYMAIGGGRAVVYSKGDVAVNPIKPVENVLDAKTLDFKKLRLLSQKFTLLLMPNVNNLINIAKVPQSADEMKKNVASLKKDIIKVTQDIFASDKSSNPSREAYIITTTINEYFSKILSDIEKAINFIEKGSFKEKDLSNIQENIVALKVCLIFLNNIDFERTSFDKDGLISLHSLVQYSTDKNIELKIFKGFEAFIGLREAKDLFNRLKDVIDIRESERFRHVIPLLLTAKKELKDPDEPHKMHDSYYRYPSNCQPCSVHAMRILKKFHFKAELRTIEFPEEIYPDLNIDKHSFAVTEIGGEEFIIDIAADQFELLGENKWADLGVVVLPVDVVNQYPTRFWMYIGQRVPTGSSAQLLEQIIPAVVTRIEI